VLSGVQTIKFIVKM